MAGRGIDLQITGAEGFGAVASRLKEQGEKGLRRELGKAIRLAVAAPIEQAKSNAASNLPKAGGLAQLVADSQIAARTRSGSNPGVTVTAKSLSVANLRALDRGYVRHPVFGQDVWVNQQVPSATNWFTGPMQDCAPLMRSAIEQAMNDVARRIGG